MFAGFEAGASASDYVKVPPRAMPRAPLKPPPVFRSLAGDGKAAPKRRLSKFGTPDVEQPAAPQVGAASGCMREGFCVFVCAIGVRAVTTHRSVAHADARLLSFTAAGAPCSTAGGVGQTKYLESSAAAVTQVKLAPPPPHSASQAVADSLRQLRGAGGPPAAASVDPFAAMGQHGELGKCHKPPISSC
jgi:hypothetical protein